MPNESLRIDTHALNGLEFRIDAFSVPAGSRYRFEALMRRNVALIETRPGLLHHTVFEKTQGTTLYDIGIVMLASFVSSVPERARSTDPRDHNGRMTRIRRQP